MVYSLFKRKRENGQFFYVQFKDPDTGIFSPAKSVEKLRRDLGDSVSKKILNRYEADAIVRRYIESGLMDGDRDEDVLLADYLQSFWDYDNSKFIKMANKRSADGLVIGRDHASNMASCIRNHVLPFLPKGLTCSQVKTKHIEKIQTELVSNRSVNIWQMTKKALSKPINELRRTKVLATDPMEGLLSFTESKRSTVGALTDRETEKLITQMYYDTFEPFEYDVEQLEEDGSVTVLCRRKARLPKEVYLATCLASATGMRKGEIQALRVSAIRFPNSQDSAEDQALIDVQEAFARKQGFKTPKSKVSRTVPCPLWLAQELVSFAEENSSSDLVFSGTTGNGNPLAGSFFNKWFNIELQHALGMHIKERSLERHIVFHSLRHYANTEYRTKVGDEKTQRVIGHTSTKMTDRYDAGSDQRILDIGKLAGDLIQNPKKEKEA